MGPLVSGRMINVADGVLRIRRVLDAQRDGVLSHQLRRRRHRLLWLVLPLHHGSGSVARTNHRWVGVVWSPLTNPRSMGVVTADQYLVSGRGLTRPTLGGG